jgi:putative acetyltransferase
MKIRLSTPSDTATIAQLFTESVHHIAANSYNPEQLAAWAPTPPDIDQWNQRLANLTTLVAEAGKQLAGFLSYTENGYIEFLYSSPHFSRQGIASELFDTAKSNLTKDGVSKLSTDASLEAMPFFKSKGFEIVEEQQVERHGQTFTRFQMKNHRE